MRRVLLILGLSVVVFAAGCGSPASTTSTGAADAPSTTGTTTPPRSTPSTARKTPAKTPPASTAPGAKKPTTSTAGGSASPSTTTTLPTGPGDLKDFCATAKDLNVTSLEAFAQVDKKGALKLVIGWTHLEKVAPPDIVAAVADMHPLADELNVQVKKGTVHDVESYKAWLQELNDTKAESIRKWIVAQQLLVPYVTSHCT